MKNLLLGLCVAALVGRLAAQEAVSPVNHVVRGAACAEACPAKVCVSEPSTKKVNTTVYGSKCLEYCLPKCGSLFSRGCDTTCADNCGPVRSKNVLLKKVVTTECPDTKCVVTLAPACTTAAPAVSAPAVKDAPKK